MSWLILFLAGLLEVVWAVGLKATEGFRKPQASALVVAAIVASLFLLAQAVRTIPIGTAYAIWSGIGAAGAMVFGIIVYGESASLPRLGFLGLLLVSIVGLKLTAR